jgi:hypothetical protein
MQVARTLFPLWATVARSGLAAGSRTAASAPCVYDSLVSVIVIDHDGERHTVQGLKGTSIASAMYASGQFKHFDDFTCDPVQRLHSRTCA